MFLFLLTSVGFLTSCKKDTEITFKTETYIEKTSLPCTDICPEVEVKIPVVQGNSVTADSINQRVFAVVKEIIYFGEKPYTATNYKELVKSFIASYEQLKTEFPKDTFGWEGKLEGSVPFKTENLLNYRIDHYTFTGGAHGYQGVRSLLFNPETGKIITLPELFKDLNGFSQYAETEFRKKYKIPETDNINSTGMMFEDDKFALPFTILFNQKGLVLYYNTYEAAAYVEGPQELTISYQQLKPYLNDRYLN
ncbi:MAG: DUF3298/DUF4163 domain-containing protein [Chitinophagaceae bacterium]|nr:MAG: DUF3298/DUF4163 domain-containing protein [Chitinophagaceae bacterium]